LYIVARLPGVCRSGLRPVTISPSVAWIGGMLGSSTLPVLIEGALWHLDDLTHRHADVLYAATKVKSANSRRQSM
jgi:hypothetical protein